MRWSLRMCGGACCIMCAACRMLIIIVLPMQATTSAPSSPCLTVQNNCTLTHTFLQGGVLRVGTLPQCHGQGRVLVGVCCVHAQPRACACTACGWLCCLLLLVLEMHDTYLSHQLLVAARAALQVLRCL
ncbi:hypothetical protein COO60DRAFT_412618 [Scenedesmus sp. NREL 46B-D3]|nr:hypothetical protein COO60DRAFT_412618 [Scenedesmus sp. NREL 46B-D3]